MFWYKLYRDNSLSSHRIFSKCCFQIILVLYTRSFSVYLSRNSLKINLPVLNMSNSLSSRNFFSNIVSKLYIHVLSKMSFFVHLWEKLIENEFTYIYEQFSINLDDNKKILLIDKVVWKSIFSLFDCWNSLRLHEYIIQWCK